MKRIFKVVSILMSVLVLTSCFIFSVHADVGYDGINYEIDSDSLTATVHNAYTNNPEIEIPAYVNGFKVVAIQNYAFANTSVSSVVLPETLETIGEHAFSNCTELTEIIIPSSVTSVGNYCFSGCNNLERVEYLANVSCVAMSAFSECSSLEHVSLAEGITEIGSYAFSGCTSLESFPFDNILSINTGAFSKSGLKNVVLNDNVININLQAFYNCADLTYVEIPYNITSIAFNAFRNDNNLTLGVWYDSYGYQFANKNNVSYRLLDQFMLGDGNMDGYVNINDVTTIQRKLAELEEFNELQELAADANRDGLVDISDATTIQMFLAEYDIPYPIGEAITQ